MNKNFDTKKIKKDVEKKVRQEYKKNLKLLEDWKYNDIANDFITRGFKDIDVDWDYTKEQFKELLKQRDEQEEYTKENRLNYNIETKFECYIPEYSDDYWYSYIRTGYLRFADEKDLSSIIASKQREELKWILYDYAIENGYDIKEEYKYPQHIDCKLLQLYEKESIDLDALIKMTYSKCDF